MADINPTANVSPNQDNKYITDPALLKELNSVEPTPSDASQYVTDPELLKQLNAPTTKPQTEQTVLQKLFGVEPTVGPKGPGVKELL